MGAESHDEGRVNYGECIVAVDIAVHQHLKSDRHPDHCDVSLDVGRVYEIDVAVPVNIAE